MADAEIIGWYMTNEDYQESVELTTRIAEQAMFDGINYGYCTRKMEREVHLKCKCARGMWPTDPNTLILSADDGNGNHQGDLKVTFRGIGTGTVERVFAPLHNEKRGDVIGTLPTDKWVLKGNRVNFDGYANELLGVTVWSATFVSEAMHMLLGRWAGAMTPANFETVWESLQT